LKQDEAGEYLQQFMPVRKIFIFIHSHYW